MTSRFAAKPAAKKRAEIVAAIRQTKELFQRAVNAQQEAQARLQFLSGQLALLDEMATPNGTRPRAS